jgi:MFS family permease
MESTPEQSRKIRMLGWVLVVIGAFLVLLMGTITYFVVDIVAQSGTPGTTTRFTGTPEQARAMFVLFGVVIATGLAALAAGIAQIRSGRRNNALSGLVVAMGGAGVACGAWVTSIL